MLQGSGQERRRDFVLGTGEEIIGPCRHRPLLRECGVLTEPPEWVKPEGEHLLIEWIRQDGTHEGTTICAHRHLPRHSATPCPALFWVTQCHLPFDACPPHQR
jgi:hypothetical protein